jgi:hypothetical protein
MYAAYERLPTDLKRRLDGTMVMQGQQYGVGRRIDVTLPLESTHHCRQPIFVTNPGSARKALYVASQNSMWIEGMPRDESEALLEQLLECARAGVTPAPMPNSTATARTRMIDAATSLTRTSKGERRGYAPVTPQRRIFRLLLTVVQKNDAPAI